MKKKRPFRDKRVRHPRGRWLHLLSRLVLPTGTKGPLLSRLPDWRSWLGNRDNSGFPTGTNQRFCSSVVDCLGCATGFFYRIYRKSKIHGHSLNLSDCVTQVHILQNCRFDSLNLTFGVIWVHIVSKCRYDPLNLASCVMQVYVLLKCSFISQIKYGMIKYYAFKPIIIFIASFSNSFCCPFSFS